MQPRLTSARWHLQTLIDVEIQLALPIAGVLRFESQRLDLTAQLLRLRL